VPTDEELLRSISLLYLACAKLTDGDLDAREAAAIGTSVRTQIPSLGKKYADALLTEVAKEFWALGDDAAAMKDAVLEAATSLSQALGTEQLQGVLDGLVHVTRADGKVVAAETSFVAAIAGQFGLPAPDLSLG